MVYCPLPLTCAISLLGRHSNDPGCKAHCSRLSAIYPACCNGALNAIGPFGRGQRFRQKLLTPLEEVLSGVDFSTAAGMPMQQQTFLWKFPIELVAKRTTNRLVAKLLIRAARSDDHSSVWLSLNWCQTRLGTALRCLPGFVLSASTPSE